MAYSEEFKITFKDKFVELLEANGGNIKATLKSVNAQTKVSIKRSTLYNWMKEDPEFAEELNEIKEGWIDNIESAIIKSALEGNITAQIFMLKTQGKGRGYIEGVEVTKKKINVTIGKRGIDRD